MLCLGTDSRKMRLPVSKERMAQPFLGSVTHEVLCRSRFPTVVVRFGGPETFKSSLTSSQYEQLERMAGRRP